MTSLPSMQPYLDAANANAKTFGLLADIVFNASEQLLALNTDAARSIYARASATATPITPDGLRDQFSNQVNAQAQTLEEATEYLRNVNEVYLKTQSEMADINAKRVAELTESMVSMLDRYAKNSPVGGADFMTAVKSTLNNASTAYDNLIKVSREVSESNFTAATKALQPIVAASTGTAAKPPRKAA